MNNGNEMLGIRVVSTIPEAHSNSVSVYNTLEVKFSADLNRSTLNNSIMVFEDYKKVYTGVASLKNVSNFNVIEGTVSYKDQTLFFKPKEKLKTDTRYIVVVNGKITDIVGNLLAKNFVFSFNTELTQAHGPCEIITPSYGEIFNQAPILSWKNQFSDSYIIQVSKQNTFAVLLFETFFVDEDKMETVTFDLSKKFQLKEGVYYIRIKSEGGIWSPIIQFFYKEITDAVISAEDQSEDVYLKDFLDGLEDELEILEVFPADGSISNSVKTNIWYMKLKGHLFEDDIDFNNCYMFGEAFDENDDIADEHGDVQGTWAIVYDEKEDASYLIFTPGILKELEEVSVLEIIQSNSAVEATKGE